MSHSLFLTMVLTVPGASAPQENDAAAYRAALVAALHHFAEHGDHEHLKTIIDDQPKLITETLTKDDTRTLLHRAAEHGQEKIVTYLLGKGADINCTTKDGSTPLHLAGVNGQVEVVRLLLAKGAKLGLKTKPEQGEGLTALQLSEGALSCLQIQMTFQRNNINQFGNLGGGQFGNLGGQFGLAGGVPNNVGINNWGMGGLVIMEDTPQVKKKRQIVELLKSAMK